jgi:two-component system cell cycle response regulator
VKFLVADDDATSRLITEVALRSLGHECTTVSDGSQAWDAFCSDRPDVVISDWMMPGLTGLQLCRNIRRDISGHYVYFIMVSRQAAVDEIIEGMSAGADDYLVKPLVPADLRARLVAAARVTALHDQLNEQQAQLLGLNIELAALARRDALTGLGNRRALDEDLGLLEARVNRYGHSYCVALLDVDHFKAYNDRYGHQAGDEALRTVAAELGRGARSGDEVYRYGGEEFLFIFPEQSLESATSAVQRMRTAVFELGITHTDNAHGVLTVSAGVAILDGDSGGSMSDVVRQADAALYRAKELGRNRVEHAVHQPGLSGADPMTVPTRSVP